MNQLDKYIALVPVLLSNIDAKLLTETSFKQRQKLKEVKAQLLQIKGAKAAITHKRILQ